MKTTLRTRDSGAAPSRTARTDRRARRTIHDRAKELLIASPNEESRDLNDALRALQLLEDAAAKGWVA